MADVPLPRFDRLPEGERRRILGVALAEFAAAGVANASYNKIIEAAGISRTSAYNYFDGREDLLRAVLDDVAGRVNGILGDWTEVDRPAALWEALAETADRMGAHVRAHPADLAVLDAAFIDTGQYTEWVARVVANADGLRMITIDVDRELLVGATLSTFLAYDTWWMQTRPASGHRPLQILLAHLWGTVDSR